MKKITNLLIGTNNKGKLREIRAFITKIYQNLFNI